MDPVETSLLYLSSRQRVDPGSDNNAQFEVVTPNSVHTQSIVEVCPIQVSFPNLFDNVVTSTSFKIVFDGGRTVTYTTTTPLFSFTLTSTNVGYQTAEFEIDIGPGTYTRKQVIEYLQSELLQSSITNFKFTYDNTIVTLTYNNRWVTPVGSYFFDEMDFTLKLGLTQAINPDSPGEIHYDFTHQQGNHFTAIIEQSVVYNAYDTFTVTVPAGHYSALELVGILTNQADPGGSGLWEIVDDQLVCNPGSSNHTQVTITPTSTQRLAIVDPYDFYKVHSLVGGVFNFGRLNLHPLSNVFVGVSNLAASTFTHGGTGHLYDILCCIPVGKYGYGNLVYWEPSDQGLARLRLPRATIHDRVKITLFDDNLNPLYLDRHYHVDVVMKIYNSNHGQSTGRSSFF